MSEEEKQAIEKINSIVKVHKDYMQGVNEETINEKEIKAIEIVLNLIDKLQKENEELKSKCNSFYGMSATDFINKDKIREIIEKSYNDIDYFKRDILKDLEYLLGE